MHWSLGSLDPILKKSMIFNLALLIGIIRSSYDDDLINCYYHVLISTNPNVKQVWDTISHSLTEWSTQYYLFIVHDVKFIIFHIFSYLGELRGRRQIRKDQIISSDSTKFIYIFIQSNNLHSDWTHYNDVMMSAMAFQVTNLTIYLTVYSGADQRKHQSSASLAFVRGIHRWIPRTKGQ